ncbi:MAG: recombinase family protein [Thermosipho sp. (in: Bacteria)]|nr:recombinase family protein [Thermosipho sp. (in: thermotogales)]
MTEISHYPLKAAAYARYSSNNQSETSIEAQLQAIEEFARQNGYIIIEKYIDRAKSAKSDERPEFQRMISDAKNKKFDAIIVHKLDRFSRRRRDAIIYSELLKQNNIKLVSVTEPFSDDPSGELLKGVIEVVNEWYINNLRHEIKTKTKIVAMKGYFLGGVPPLGYDLEEVKDEYGNTRKRYVINEEEAEIVREIFRLYSEGFSFKKIANYLNNKGYKTKKGGHFKASSIAEILRNKKYGGIYVYNQSKHGTRIRHPHDEIIEIEGLIPAIVSKELFELVRQKLNKNSRTLTKKHNYLLLDIIYCGDCGSRMTGSGGKKPKYVCQNWKNNKKGRYVGVGKQKVEQFVISYLKNVLLPIDKIDFEKLTEELNRIEAERESLYEKKFEELMNKKAEIEKQIENITKAILRGILTDKLELKSKELEQQLRDINNEIKNLRNQALNKYSPEQVKEMYKYFLLQLNSNNELLIERAIKKLISKVIVYPRGYIDIKTRDFLNS